MKQNLTTGYNAINAFTFTAGPHLFHQGYHFSNLTDARGADTTCKFIIIKVKNKAILKLE